MFVKKIGKKMEDSSLYVGISPDTGKMIFATPQDAKDSNGTNLTLTFKDAVAYVEKLNQEKYLGHDDWHLPTKAESGVLRKNSKKGSLKRTFNLASTVIGKNGAVAFVQQSLYWSSTQHPQRPSGAWYFRIADHDQGWGAQDRLQFSLRPVRSETPVKGR